MAALEVKRPMQPLKEFIFYPLIDFYGSDQSFMKNGSAENYATVALSDTRIVCFNSSGCLKIAWQPLLATKAFNEADKGTYVKIDHGRKAKIPKIVHQIWLEGEPPRHMQDLAHGLDGWEYKLWTAKEIGGKSPEEFKYTTLATYGGIFVDSRAELLKPLDDSLLKYEFVAAFESEFDQPQVVASHILGCVPGSPVIEELTKQKRKDVAAALIVAKARVSELDYIVYPSYYFYPVQECGLCYSYYQDIIRVDEHSYFNMVWRPPEEKRPRPGPADEKKGAGVTLPIAPPIAGPLASPALPFSLAPVAMPVISPIVTPPIIAPVVINIQATLLGRELPKFLDSHSVRSVIEIPFNPNGLFFETVRAKRISYLGMAEEADLKKKYEQWAGAGATGADLQWPGVETRALNFSNPFIPNADLIYCQDLLLSLNEATIKSFLRACKKSGSRYLLASSFIGRNQNKPGLLNLLSSPYNFPLPIVVIPEQPSDERLADKCFCIWLCAHIPAF